MNAPKEIPFDVALTMHEWHEQCAAAHDTPTPTEEKEYLRALVQAHEQLENERK